MNKTIKIIICVVLALAIILGAAFGIKSCVDSKSQKPDDTIQNEIPEDDEWEDEEWEDWEEEEDDWEEEEDYYDDEEFEDLPTDDDEVSDEIYYEPVIINNASDPINKNFYGLNAVYFMYAHHPHPTGDYQYTEEQAAMEMERLKSTRMTMIRSNWGSGYVWNYKTNSYDWDNVYMQGWRKTAGLVKDMGMEMAVTASWSFGAFTGSRSTGSASDRNGEYSPSTFDGPGWVVEDDFEATLKNYKEFIKASVFNFRQHGLTNIKYFLAWTEMNNTLKITDEKLKEELIKYNKEKYGFTRDSNRDYDSLIPLYHAAMTALDEALDETGFRDEYKIVAPCDNWRNDFDEFDENKYSVLVDYTVKNLADKVDIIGSHNGYDRANEYVSDDFYARPMRTLGRPMEDAASVGKEFWIDEYSAASYQSERTNDLETRRTINSDPAKGIAMGAMLNGVMNMGKTNNLCTWMLAEQQWPNLSSGGEFDNGIQIGSGFMPSLLESSLPYQPWYSLAMLARYTGRGQIYKVNDGLEAEQWVGLYYSAMVREDGNLTVIVTNYNIDDMPIEVTFDKDIGGRTFYRHLYTLNNVVPTADAEIIPISAKAESVNNGFYDTLPAYSVSVYTTVAD